MRLWYWLSCMSMSWFAGSLIALVAFCRAVRAMVQKPEFRNVYHGSHGCHRSERPAFGYEMNALNSVFCICFDRCEWVANVWESRTVWSGTRSHEPEAATSHRYERRPKTLASDCGWQPQSNLTNFFFNKLIAGIARFRTINLIAGIARFRTINLVAGIVRFRTESRWRPTHLEVSRLRLQSEERSRTRHI